MWTKEEEGYSPFYGFEYRPSDSCVDGLGWALGRCVRELRVVEFLLGADFPAQAPFKHAWLWAVGGYLLGIFTVLVYSWWTRKVVVSGDDSRLQKLVEDREAALEKAKEDSESLLSAKEREVELAQEQVKQVEAALRSEAVKEAAHSETLRQARQRDQSSQCEEKNLLSRGVQAVAEKVSRGTVHEDERAVVLFSVGSAQTEHSPEVTSPPKAEEEVGPPRTRVEEKKVEEALSDDNPLFRGLVRRKRR